MMLTHTLSMFLFSIPTWTESLSESIHTVMLVKVYTQLSQNFPISSFTKLHTWLHTLCCRSASTSFR
jgi:hypothetical protein